MSGFGHVCSSGSAWRASARALAAGITLACVALFGMESAAQALAVPPLRDRVNDYAHLLPPERAAALEARLAEHERRTGQQLALLTVESLEGEPIETFGIEVAEQWKLGDKKRDDGLIVLVAKAEHKMRIEVGYGLEGVIPDAIASRVIREVMAPAFRNDDYAGGLDAAFAVLMDRAGGGDGSAAPLPQAKRKRDKIALFPLLLPLLLFFLLSRFGGMGGRRRRGMWVMGPGFGGGMGGGGFGGGGFGGGGGGFSGGGGGFGGGGASGDW